MGHTGPSPPAPGRSGGMAAKGSCPSWRWRRPVDSPWLAIALERPPQNRSFCKAVRLAFAINRGLSRIGQMGIHPGHLQAIEPLSHRQQLGPSGQSCQKTGHARIELENAGPCGGPATGQALAEQGFGVGLLIVGISCQWQAAPQVPRVR